MSLKVRSLNVTPDYLCYLTLYNNKGAPFQMWVLNCEGKSDGIYSVVQKLDFISTQKVTVSKYRIQLFQDHTFLVENDYPLSVKLKKGDTLHLTFAHPFLVF